MILFEDDDAPLEVHIEALEARILEMIEEAALALGIEPTGWAWRCSECGKNVRPDNSFGHDGGPDLHCGPVGIAPEHAKDAWRDVLAAIRGRQGAAEILDYVVVDRGGKLYRYQDGEPSHLYRPRERNIAESFCVSLNRAGDDGPIDSRAPWRVAPVGPAVEPERPPLAVEILGFCVLSRDGEPVSLSVCQETAEDHRDKLNSRTCATGPFRVVPVGPVVDLKPFGWGVIDKDGGALVQHVFRDRGAAEHSATGLNQASGRMATPLPDAPFAAVQLFYAPPPDRPAEESKADPRAERWAAIPKVGKP